MKKRLIQILWRGWHLSPLFVAGRYTMHFTKGIAFGYSNPVWLTIYFGWLIISIDNDYNRKPANMYKRSYKHIWIVKYGRI